MVSSRTQNVIVWTAVGIGAVVAVSFATTAILRKRKRGKVKRVIDTVLELQKPCVRMKDPERVEELVCKLIKGGPKKLQVVTDFDHTISRSHLNGKACCSTHGVLECSSLIAQDFQVQAEKIHEKYYPIEIDPYMSTEEKIPYMVEWYSKSHAILVNCGIKKRDIPQLVVESSIMLRDGCESFFEMLHEHQIPTLVFSAGLGDILEETLKHFQCYFPNLKFISNYMQFDDEGNIIGFKGELIHMYNKNRTSVATPEYFHNVKEKTKIVLLGDSLGDLGMLGDMESQEVVLRIGFLNNKRDNSDAWDTQKRIMGRGEFLLPLFSHGVRRRDSYRHYLSRFLDGHYKQGVSNIHQIEERLQQYMNSFDIVLIDDQTMDVVNGILRKIIY